ncbi:MAG TPA: hypothetical protein VH540_12290 [Ktedonobacterales bacterium]|jgi:hypothetical protein
MQMLEGTVTEKQQGLRASFQGTERPYVRAIVSRQDAPDVMRQVRIYDVEDIPQQVGEAIRLEVLRVTTDRKTGVVWFDCKLA